MGYFQVRYDSRVIHYDRRGFIRLAAGDFIFRIQEGSAMGSRTKQISFKSSQFAL